MATGTRGQRGQRRALGRPPYEAALRVSVQQLVEQIEAAIRDPAEYIPSRIRFSAREVRAVLDYIEEAES